ncbi:probable peptidyl-tRNA hydrolase 2 [Drosophila tropicalis]|uniref:probable peptidyl-tRNA hydrolase 2 n=1 Tax=Drosophila tropicalis TaxID=46794 RepID=UPI0035ABF7C1
MGDKLLDSSQIINGLAVILSFFVGYRYALSYSPKREESEACAKIDNETAAGSMGQATTAAAADRNFAGYSENFKMVLVVRNDLKMGKGKIAAQCGHAAVGAYQQAVKKTPRLLRSWENCGCAKIAVRVESEPEMMAIKRAAEKQLLNTCLIRDAGRTQIAANSKTVLAIGPANATDIDLVTGHLKLL